MFAIWKANLRHAKYNHHMRHGGSYFRLVSHIPYGFLLLRKSLDWRCNFLSKLLPAKHAQQIPFHQSLRSCLRKLWRGVSILCMSRKNSCNKKTRVFQQATSFGCCTGDFSSFGSWVTKTKEPTALRSNQQPNKLEWATDSQSVTATTFGAHLREFGRASGKSKFIL